MLGELADQALHFGLKVVFAVLTFLIGVQVIKLIRRIVQKALTRANAEKGVLQFLDSLLKVALYVVLIFMIATSFGVSVAGVVTLLGSAGVAIGLSLQGSLSNLAGGVLILLLKPFKVGDYIIEDTKGNEGTVTEIQMFYTKLTTPDQIHDYPPATSFRMHIQLWKRDFDAVFIKSKFDPFGQLPFYVPISTPRHITAHTEHDFTLSKRIDKYHNRLIH